MNPAMPRRTRLAAAVTLIALSMGARAGDFIRVDEDEKAARLQTAVTRYEKDGATVDLLGAVHIADKAYYEKLNERFKGYDAVLFEMIGGEDIAAKRAAEAENRDVSGLHKVYDMVAGFLKLTGQVQAIDYTAGNLVHADLTLEEFSAMQRERGESLLGFALKAGREGQKNAKQPDPTKLLTALLSGKSDLVKLEIVHTLGQGDDQIASFAGESVIISDRNRRCIEVMNRELAAGKKNLGIFYGAAHFPEMEKRLLELGFKRVKQDWLTAWDIPKEKREPAAAEKKKDAA